MSSTTGRMARPSSSGRKLLHRLRLPNNPLGYFLSRIPDNMELAHRHIARSSWVQNEDLIPPHPEKGKSFKRARIAKAKPKQQISDLPKTPNMRDMRDTESLHKRQASLGGA